MDTETAFLVYLTGH